MEQTIKANGIEICYETFGDPAAPTVLFVMGLGAQMITWPDLFMTGLTGAGCHVVRYDNRDVGLSTKFHDAGTPDFRAIVSAMSEGRKPDVPYTLRDMAADGIGLLDALGIERAHVVGASMGGMIVQQMAIDSGDRLASMVSIMSNTGDPSLPPPSPEAMAVLTKPGPDTDNIEELVAHAMANRKVVGGEGFEDTEQARQLSAAVIRRQFYPVGAARQRAGIMASGSRTEALRRISTPTLVIHGDSDPLVPVQGGIHTAEVIPGARLEILKGMGHAQFPKYQPELLRLITGHVRDNS
jgi:pimeloyl-ACP methyl ester carboxylesterase